MKIVLAVFFICLLTCGCSILPRVESARKEIDNNILALETARHTIEGATQALDASTRSISENIATVNRSTVGIERLSQLLNDFLNALDRLAAKKKVFWALIIGGAMLVLVPVLVFLVFFWKLGRSMAALATRMDKFQRGES